MLTQTQAIKAFLESHTRPDLAELYSAEMEVQVNAAQDNGTRVSGEFQGRTWHGWSDPKDPTLIWKSFRIPHKAKTEPEYTEKSQKWPLAKHTEGIGMTGWNWAQRKSIWVGYDFDSIANHQQGLTAEELEEVRNRAMAIPWITVRKSTSGKGYHLYVFLNGVETQNHTEHAALGRAILGMLSAKTGFDFSSKVDACGGNLWVYHRKMEGTDGLTLVKQGEVLDEPPVNWKDHLEVVSGNRRKNLPRYVETDQVDWFEELCGTRPRIKLDETHLRLQSFLDEIGAQWWWDQDHWMMVAHTADLKRAHSDLNLRGIFDTVAKGKERGADHNCLSGNTEILTREGVRKIKDVAGTQQYLWVNTPEGMKWINCEIQSFGRQPTVQVSFGNNSTVRATLNHRWYYCGNGDYNLSQDRVKYTYELRESYGTKRGEYLPLAEFKLNEPDWTGYAHGFVFGDGWNRNCRGVTSTEVKLFKKDKDLLTLLAKYGNVGDEFVEGHGYIPCVRQLPNHWKELPKNVSKEYALGFILGLFCADNSVCSAGSFRIGQANYEKMKCIRELALYAGLRARNLSWVPRSGGYKTSDDGFWLLTIETYNLKSEWILRSDLRRSIGIKTKCHTTVVKSVSKEVREEEVFCAVVPSYHNFTLANGVITGNCFCFPLRRGAWVVRRYGEGIQEHPSWDQDGRGYTRAFLNQEPDLQTASRSQNGVEMEQGGFIFTDSRIAAEVASSLGVTIGIPQWAHGRQTVLKHHKKDGRLIVELKRESADNGGDMLGWRDDKGWWKKIFNTRVTPPSEPEVGNFDDLVRHLITDTGDDYGWVVNAGSGWQTEPINHVKLALKSINHSDREINSILGNCVLRGWTLVNRPFEDEFPGDRQWNRGAAQLRFKPKIEGPYECETWLSILNHCGAGLDQAVKKNPWCQSNGVNTGGEYLLMWVASLFQKPTEHLPYLFFFSEEENTGKSTFHQALSLLMTKGYVDGKTALTSSGGFTGELESAILCYVEELDLSKHREARNRIKEWVTGKYISVHKKGQTPYQIKNCTHWVQTANSMLFCPTFPGDTRIVVSYVKPLTEEIPEARLYQLLEKEAGDFLGKVMAIELPYPEGRLSIPVVDTEEKRTTSRRHMSPLELFIEEQCHKIPGSLILYADFYDKFVNWLDAEEVGNWSKIRVGRELPRHYPKGRNMSDGAKFYVGNLSFNKSDRPGPEWYLEDNALRQ